MIKLNQIAGITERDLATLTKAGVNSAQKLLDMGGTPEGRKELAKATGIDAKKLMQWLNYVDLFRVKGIGVQFAKLLEEAGVDTIPELAQRSAANLHAKMLEVNNAQNVILRPPQLEQVEDWVNQAKALPRAIHY